MCIYTILNDEIKIDTKNKFGYFCIYSSLSALYPDIVKNEESDNSNVIVFNTIIPNSVLDRIQEIIKIINNDEYLKEFDISSYDFYPIYYERIFTVPVIQFIQKDIIDDYYKDKFKSEMRECAEIFNSSAIYFDDDE